MRAQGYDTIVIKGNRMLPVLPIDGTAVRKRLHTPWAVWGKLPMAITAGVPVEIPGLAIGGRTPVIPPPPLAILGEPVLTKYMVDSHDGHSDQKEDV